MEHFFIGDGEGTSDGELVHVADVAAGRMAVQAVQVQGIPDDFRNEAQAVHLQAGQGQDISGDFCHKVEAGQGQGISGVTGNDVQAVQVLGISGDGCN